ncbi:hypothetical protein KJ966_04680 [bacterium]|nr:hypothetical protein [bacterium]
MITYSFIGSDKNAGKTTVLNFVYRQLNHSKSDETDICITSIGINGESIDNYERKEKPTIQVQKGSYFITAGEHLAGKAGNYITCCSFCGPGFLKTYVLGKALLDFFLIIEGPNDKTGLIKLKQKLAIVLKNSICLIDGSIDRQFIGHPDVSDYILFSLLITERREQQQKTADLILALSLQLCSVEQRVGINQYKENESKSILLAADGSLLYHGINIPFMDKELKQICHKNRKECCILYLNGAFGNSLHQFLAPMRKLDVVLDNFTLYQNITTGVQQRRVFSPRLFLYHAVPVKKIFLKQENWNSQFRPSVEVPVHNLFRDDPYEIGI